MILSLTYNLSLFLYGLIHLPLWLFQTMRYGKYRSSFLQRLGAGLPAPSATNEQVIWIHTISLGETRAMIPLYKRIKATWPSAKIYISTITETGQAEAKRSLSGADGYFYLPLDFSPIIQKAIDKIAPDLLILCESDFWLQLLKGVRKRGGKILLANGKLSERSLKGFSRLRFFSRPLFGQIDHLCVQSELFSRRFQNLGIPEGKITITGNLKFDATQQALTSEEKSELRNQFKLLSSDRIVTIGSTHEGEESLILDQLDRLWAQFPNLKALLAPRHPERFEKIAQLLSERAIKVGRYSKKESLTGEERILLIDTIGLLPNLFQISECAIIGGSYLPGVGGHNIFEPIQAHIPVLFGPYMETQPQQVLLVLDKKAGIESPAEKIEEHLLKLLKNAELQTCYCTAAQALDQEARGSLDRTFERVKKLLD